MSAATPLPRDLDLWAIHRGLLAAGYTRQRTEPAYVAAANWVYTAPGPEFAMVALPNPEHGLAAASDTSDDLPRKVAVQALDVLIAATGDQHLECGPRTERERLLIDVVNATNNFA